MAEPEKLQEEVDRNYSAFQKELPSLLPTHAGKFALMRHGKIIEFFDTARDAHVAGRELFKQDGLYSVQEVTDSAVDLGFFSHAVPERAV